MLDKASVIRGDLKIEATFRRHRSLRIEDGNGIGYLVKIGDPLADDGQQTLTTERRFYELCRQDPRARALEPFMARHRALKGNGEETVVVLELLTGARELWDVYRDDGLPRAPAAALGRALATLHSALSPRGDSKGGETFASPPVVPGGSPELVDTPPPPRFLTIQRPHPSLLRRMSPANHRLLRLVQADESTVRQLDAALGDWHAAPAAVIHGDIRSSNVLVAGSADIKLVDWESVQRGDPAWDIAGALQDFLLFWFRGMPDDPALENAERIRRAAWPLADLRPMIAAFYTAYTETAELAESVGDGFLQRAVRYSGARLLQAAWESSAHDEQLSSRAILLLQSAVNILRDASAATRGIYGLG